MGSLIAKIIKFLKMRKERSQNLEVEETQENVLPNKEVDEPPSINSLHSQEGPTFPVNLNDLVLQAKTFREV